MKKQPEMPGLEQKPGPVSLAAQRWLDTEVTKANKAADAKTAKDELIASMKKYGVQKVSVRDDLDQPWTIDLTTKEEITKKKAPEPVRVNADDDDA